MKFAAWIILTLLIRVIPVSASPAPYTELIKAELESCIEATPEILTKRSNPNPSFEHQEGPYLFAAKELLERFNILLLRITPLEKKVVDWTTSEKNDAEVGDYIPTAWSVFIDKKKEPKTCRDFPSGRVDYFQIGGDECDTTPATGSCMFTPSLIPITKVEFEEELQPIEDSQSPSSESWFDSKTIRNRIIAAIIKLLIIVAIVFAGRYVTGRFRKSD